VVSGALNGMSRKFAVLGKALGWANGSRGVYTCGLEDLKDEVRIGLHRTRRANGLQNVDEDHRLPGQLRPLQA
jgi:hypothetical protein